LDRRLGGWVGPSKYDFAFLFAPSIIVSMKPRTFVRSSVSIGSDQLSKNFSSATLASAFVVSLFTA
jgi:hypothetical protein